MFFDGQLVGWKSVEIPGYGMPYQDMLTLHCAAIGMSGSRAAAIVLDEDLYPESFISQEIKLSIAEMRRREGSDGIDVQLSPFLERYGAVTPLFHVINHPMRPALAYMANTILTRLGYTATVPLAGKECLSFPHVPLTKSVTRFLASRGEQRPEWALTDSGRYVLPTATFTPVEYCARVVGQLRSHSREELLAPLKGPHVLPFLQRLAEAVPGIPGIEMWRTAEPRLLAGNRDQ
jgi:hypothetical protein